MSGVGGKAELAGAEVGTELAPRFYQSVTYTSSRAASAISQSRKATILGRSAVASG